jgi:membrane-associated phospholipid phosphatase
MGIFISDYSLVILFILSASLLKNIPIILSSFLILLVLDPLTKFALSPLKLNKPDSSRPGMPSGHAWTAFFLASTLVMKSKDPCVKIIASFLAIIVANMRVVENEHTIPQIIVGSLLGICSGVAFVMFI